MATQSVEMSPQQQQGHATAAKPASMAFDNGKNVSTSKLEWTAPVAGNAPNSKIGRKMSGMTQSDRIAALAAQKSTRTQNVNGTNAGKVADISIDSKGPTFATPTIGKDSALPISPTPSMGATPSIGGATPLRKRTANKVREQLPGSDNQIHKMNVDVLRNPNPIAEDIPSNHKLTDMVAMSSIEERTLSEFDHLYRQKNYHMGVLVIIETALMILIFQYPWNPDTGVYDSSADSVWIIQTVISCVTAYHLLKIWDYYQLIVVTDRVKYSLRNRDGIFQSFRLKYMIVEMLLVVLHSVPYVMESKPSLFIFGRMYQLFRVVRDHSNVYKWRKKIITNGHLSGLPEFDVSLTLRTYFHLYPWPSLFIFISWWILVLSYAIYIFERELQFKTFDYANTIYFTAGTMATLGYGDLVPVSNGGRTVAMIAVVVGILCSALLVTALLRQIKLTPNQIRIAEYVAEEQLNRNEQRHAALLIQKAYRKWAANRRDAAQDGVEVMTVTDDGIEQVTNPKAKSSILRHGQGVCGTSCCGLYYQPPTDQQVLNAAKKNREMRYYRFLTNMANASNINPVTTMEQRMERMEDMLLFMMEELVRLSPGGDEQKGVSTTETSRLGSPDEVQQF